MAKSARINVKPKAAKATPQTFIQRSRDKGSSEKAYYHNVTGAGKSKVKREYLGTTKEDKQAIKQALIDGQLREMRKQTGRG